MAMKILLSKLNVVEQRGVYNACSAMSSTSAPAPTSQTSTPELSNLPRPNNKEKLVSRKESFKSFVYSMLGLGMESAEDPNKMIPLKEMSFPDTVEHATGEAKLLYLAFENGFVDPYCTFPIERGTKGSKDDPIKVPSWDYEKSIGCRCEPSQPFYKFTILYKGTPKRCHCGHWMELTDAPKFWESIPKDDLIDIPFFLELHMDGKLDDFLAGKFEEKDDWVPDDVWRAEERKRQDQLEEEKKKRITY